MARPFATGICADCGASGRVRMVEGATYCLEHYRPRRLEQMRQVAKRTPKKRITCRACGREGQLHHGHGLCAGCAKRNMRNGTLEYKRIISTSLGLVLDK